MIYIYIYIYIYTYICIWPLYQCPYKFSVPPCAQSTQISMRTFTDKVVIWYTTLHLLMLCSIN